MEKVEKNSILKYEKKEQVKKMLPEYLIKHLGIENINKNFRCLNPNHHDKNPSMSYDKDNNFVHCFSCGSTYDIFNLVGIDYGIIDFNEQYKKALDIFHLVEINFEPSKTFKKSILSSVWYNYTKNNSDGSKMEYIERCYKDKNKTNYFSYRGINETELIDKYKLGFDVKLDCVILPTSENYYIRRNTQNNGKNKYYNLPNKTTEILNINYLKNLEINKNIFIVEGYFDALSIELFDEYAISLNSTSNIGKFIEFIQEFKPKNKLLISLDNDDTGKKAQKKLIKELERLNTFFLEVDLSKEYKDPSEHYMKDPSSFINAIKDSLEEVKNYEELKNKEIEIKKEIYKNENNINSYLATFLNYIEKTKTIEKVPTYFNQLDAILEGGLYEGLYILGAISSLGKTTFMLQIADRIARNNQDVLIFSLEMSKNELIAKSLSRLTYSLGNKVSAKTVRGILDGKRHQYYNDTEKELFKKAFDEYSKISKNLYITESLGDVGVNEIRESIERHISFTNKYPIVIIDYLQILNPIDNRLTDKQNMDKSVSELKRISREFQIPVLAVSSLNRDNYNNKISMLAFKESGAIEYSSDVLIGLQLKGAGAKDFDVDKAKQKNLREIELKILKNRNGRTGDIIEYEYHPMFNYFMEK